MTKLNTSTLSGESVSIEYSELFSNCCGVNPNLETHLSEVESLDIVDFEELSDEEKLEYVFLLGLCPACKEHALFTNYPYKL